MDRSNQGRTPNPPDTLLAPRPDNDRTSPRLQKRSHNPNSRVLSDLPTDPQPQGYASRPTPSPFGAPEISRARKNSLRQVVRKFFGRRSRDVEQESGGDLSTLDETQDGSTLGHGYHRSDVTGLATTQEVPEAENVAHAEPVVPTSDAAQRTISAPSMAEISQRARSPYAVAFPSHSLKPLDLPNPFAAPGSQLRRRKTTSSIRQDVPGKDASSNAAAKKLTRHASKEARDSPSPEVGLAIGTVGNVKRRSRSADDLNSHGFQLQSPPRKRGEEIKYWRESYQDKAVLEDNPESGMPTSKAIEDRRTGDLLPELQERHAFQADSDDFVYSTAKDRTSAFHKHGQSFNSIPDAAEQSVFGTEATKELEDRVARLEAGLLNFSRSLQRLTAERNRRTIVVADSPLSHRRSWDRTRTPSMLADTLGQRPPTTDTSRQFRVEEYQPRPATSPAPSTPPLENRLPIMPSLAASTIESAPSPRDLEEPFRTPSQQQQQQQHRHHQPRQSQPQQQPQEYTFRSLYQMLTDERSARRRLETQVRSLRSEISSLQYQVSSGVVSERSSYGAIPRGDNSTRLRQMLTGTEESLRSQQRESGEAFTLEPTGSHVMSRFSATDSEAFDYQAEGPDEDEHSINTPYDAYQTPVEEYNNGMPSYPPSSPHPQPPLRPPLPPHLSEMHSTNTTENRPMTTPRYGFE